MKAKKIMQTSFIYNKNKQIIKIKHHYLISRGHYLAFINCFSEVCTLIENESIIQIEQNKYIIKIPGNFNWDLIRYSR